MSLILSFFFLLNTLSIYSVNQELTVISSYCYIYSSPSFLESEKITIENEPYLLYHNDKVEYLEEKNNFYKVKICDKDITGYVYKYYLTSNTSQSLYPVFNASIRKDTLIYDIDKNPTDYIATKGQGVYLYNGFDDKNEFTAVQIVLENGDIYNGYIKSQDISPNGVSNLLIVGISIIAACVTIILTIVFLKKKKK